MSIVNIRFLEETIRHAIGYRDNYETEIAIKDLRRLVRIAKHAEVLLVDGVENEGKVKIENLVKLQKAFGPDNEDRY